MMLGVTNNIDLVKILRFLMKWWWLILMILLSFLWCWSRHITYQHWISKWPSMSPENSKIYQKTVHIVIGNQLNDLYFWLMTLQCLPLTYLFHPLLLDLWSFSVKKMTAGTVTSPAPPLAPPSICSSNLEMVATEMSLSVEDELPVLVCLSAVSSEMPRILVWVSACVDLLAPAGWSSDPGSSLTLSWSW